MLVAALLLGHDPGPDARAGHENESVDQPSTDLMQMVDVSADVAGQLLTKQYRREKIFGMRQAENPFRAPGSVRP